VAAEDREMKRIRNERDKHTGQWLTAEAVSFYQEKAKSCAQISGQDIGERRKLREELQERFGLLEIEAINILNGFYGAFYVEKYRRIKACEPLQKNAAKKAQETED